MHLTGLPRVKLLRENFYEALAITFKVFLFSILIAYIAAVQITITERDVPTSNIKSFGDGLWWAVTTVTTVGYGDTYPVSTQGRIVGTALMIMGVALLGTITASIASNFNQTNSEDTIGGTSASELDALKQRVAELEGKLDS